MTRRIHSDPSTMERDLLGIVLSPGYEPARFRDLRHQLNCPKHLVPELSRTVTRLVEEGRLMTGPRDTLLPGPLSRKRGSMAREERPDKGWSGPASNLAWKTVVKMWMENQKLPGPFSAAIEAGVRKLSEPSEEDFKGREDFRGQDVCTIDPADARDHDDAVSVEDLPGGKWQLDVHIADVAQYVQEGTALDKQALKRSFTNYLPWTAIPMLPESLSSNLCSLLDNHDRLALSCRMVIDRRGQILSYRFCESVIRVRRFLAYEEAQKLCDEGDASLARLKACSETLRKARMSENLLDFDLPEARIRFNEAGEPEKAVASVRLPSHQWIEEAMLAANRSCARLLDEKDLPGVYRVHEAPAPETLAAINSWAQALDLDVGRPPRFDLESEDNLNPAVQAWFARLLSCENLPKGLQGKILRSMKKARYSAGCVGHFALGWLHYAHYTSPIRRYSDLWTHRVIKAHLRGEKLPAAWEPNSRRIAAHISAREEEVVKAERSATKSCLAWILKDHLGEIFDGEIMGIEAMGMFIQLKEPWAEGMLHVRNMNDDYYEHNPDRMELCGSRGGRSFKVGDPIKVQLVKADPVAGFIDFGFAPQDPEAAPGELQPVRRAAATRSRRPADNDAPSTRGSGRGRSPKAFEKGKTKGKSPRRKKDG